MGFSMLKSDVTCPKCRAGFRRLELTSVRGSKGQYHCPTCNTVLEVFDGGSGVFYRLTVVPSEHLESRG
jgi:transposase-like protein